MLPGLRDDETPDKLRAVRGLFGFATLAGVLVALLLLPAAFTAGVSTRDAAGWFEDVPDGVDTSGVPERSTILAADGSSIATFYFQNRIDVPFAKIAPVARQAVLAIEDSRFYQHGALDSKGTLRALISNLGHGQVTQGGSGITQQYVKNLLLTQATTATQRKDATELSAGRKMRELRYAVAMEKRYSKDEILRRYLNIAYFGDGAYGVEAASRHYFSKHAAQLNLPEAALLAGIVRYPFAYDPVNHPDAARQRRDVVLARMAQLGWIPQATADAAAKQPVQLHVHQARNGCVSSSAPFFCDYVQREILTNAAFGKTKADREKLLKQGGLTIRTTLNWKTQNAAQKAVDGHVPPRNSAHKAAAEALVEPGTGAIRGMAVDRDLGPDNQRGKTWINFAADADHGSSIGMQSGSTFKVFTLAAALQDDMPFGTMMDAPTSFTPTGYRNCDGKRVGDPNASLRNSADGEGGQQFSLVTGTWHSVNTFFLGLEKEIGLCETVQMAEKLGMRQANGKPLEEYPSFTLGFNPVSPLRLASAYATFAARGKYCRPVAITSVTDTNGKAMKVPSAGCKQVLDKGVADAVNYILQGVLTKGTAAGSGIGRPAAGKTGTVDNFSAAWFAGYTPDLASAVWVGDPRGGYKYPMDNLCMSGECYGEVFGATIPAPIWQDTMSAALDGTSGTDFHSPPSHYFSMGDGETDPSKKDKKDKKGKKGGDKKGGGTSPTTPPSPTLSPSPQP